MFNKIECNPLSLFLQDLLFHLHLSRTSPSTSTSLPPSAYQNLQRGEGGEEMGGEEGGYRGGSSALC